MVAELRKLLLSKKNLLISVVAILILASYSAFIGYLVSFIDDWVDNVNEEHSFIDNFLKGFLTLIVTFLMYFITKWGYNRFLLTSE